MPGVRRTIVSAIKKIVPVSSRVRVRYWLSRSDDTFEYLRGKKKAIVALAADYANLGDVAITMAQGWFLSEHLPEREVVYFPCRSTYTHMKSLRHVCNSDDLITITGGGNMGDRYASLEDARRFIVERFPHNQVISFPQTVDFSDTPEGRRELHLSRRAYGRHRNLHLFAREPASLDRMKEYFPKAHVALVPDIALSLDESKPRRQRHGVLLCLRDDLESASPSCLRSDLVSILTSGGRVVREVDTLSQDNNRLPVESRIVELQGLLDAFRAAEIVITDRLHGMIFSAITGTPCVAFRSKNHKIKSTYDSWLRAHEYIRLQDDFAPDHSLQLIEDLGKRTAVGIHQPDLTGYYDPLRKAVTGQE
jgi:pyruvyl transferase EpsI